MSNSPRVTDGKYSFDDYFEHEYRQLIRRRHSLAVAGLASESTEPELHENISDASLASAALKAELCGLAISGGGIRSATFGLGVLQGLAECGLLARFDLLSTVSGGGYIGGWLSAWIRERGFQTVIERLRPTFRELPENVEAKEIRHLRYYSNYLTPRPGLFSLDGWTLVAIYARNLLLNVLVLFIALLGFFAIVRSVVELFTMFAQYDLASNPSFIDFEILWRLIIITGLLVAVNIAGCAYWDFVQVRANQSNKGLVLFNVICIAPRVLVAICAALLISFPFTRACIVGIKWIEPWAIIACGFAAYHFGIGLLARGNRAAGAFRGILAGWMAGSLLYILVFTLIHFGISHSPCPLATSTTPASWNGAPIDIGNNLTVALFATLAVPAILFSMVVANYLHVGFMGSSLQDPQREFWSSIDARLIAWSTGWILVVGLTVFGPWIIRQGLSEWRGAAIAALGSGWIGTVAAGLWAAKSQSTHNVRSMKVKALLAKSAPYVFILGMLVIAAAIATWIMYDLDDAFVRGRSPAARNAQFWTTPSCNLLTDLNDFKKDLIKYPVTVSVFHGLLAGAGVCLFLSWLLGNYVGVNRFSLHNVYKNRVVRCYLGAIRDRNPSVVTNIDTDDDVPLATLAPNGSRSTSEPYRREQTDHRLLGPFHIINAALNCKAGNVRGRNESQTLALRDRKAEAFVFTPSYCGSATTGYCPTETFAENVTLGTAMATSGAAIAPNMGFLTSPAVTVLLTIFNLRLGAWFGNPCNPQSRSSANPPASWIYFLRELFGQTHVDKEYIYISDGGHFENTGVYELLRRRCRFIVAIDAGVDPGLFCANLGNLLRKARVDLNVNIDIDLSKTKARAGELCESHFAVGRIVYGGSLVSDEGQSFDTPKGLVDGLGENEGILVYIKTGLTGDEPVDVLNYAAENPAFPNESTVDQFYSESQFESYRTLGLHSVRRVFNRVELSQSTGEIFGALKVAE